MLSIVALDVAETPVGAHRRSLVGRLSLRKRLIGIAIVGQLFTMALSLAAVVGMQQMIDASGKATALSRARALFQDADLAHDALRGDTYRGVLAAKSEGVAGGAPRDRR